MTGKLNFKDRMNVYKAAGQGVTLDAAAIDQLLKMVDAASDHHQKADRLYRRSIETLHRTQESRRRFVALAVAVAVFQATCFIGAALIWWFS